MASLKDIRNRITSVKNTQKITSSMKMVSSAKMSRAQKNIGQARPYSEKLRKVVSTLSRNFTEEDHALFQSTEGNRTGVILITSDRGLCGGFNSTLCKKVAAQLAQDQVTAEMAIVGRKGRDAFKNTPHSIQHVYMDVRVEDRLGVVKQILDEFVTKFENKELDRVYLAYSHLVSIVSQQPVLEMLLPIEPPETENWDERDFIFEPSPEMIMDTLLRKYVQNQVYVGWLDSIAGEHAARMMAMDSATKNAGEMIDKLQLHYNRTRQAAITKELIEIISGAESL
ncbi:ATP synthase F1 subunit gamma [Deltaproteobacteria bacterium TL4]